LPNTFVSGHVLHHAARPGCATLIDMTDLRDRFRALHESGTFLLPNPWDAGSAKLLAGLGFPALATTSSGLAASLGKLDQQVTRDELVAHVAAVTAAVRVPLNVDAERCFAEQPDGIAETVDLLAGAGAAGISIEDYDPVTERIETLAAGAERVAAAAEACARHGIVLTARAENHLYGHDDLTDTIDRLRAYRAAGADVVYAPGLRTPADIARLVDSVPAPVNVLAVAGAPDVAELTRLGVRRISTGGALAWVAYGALRDAARELRDSGTTTYRARALTSDEVDVTFGPGA
jgi:2-methylisocitrate lyase-like PEP mutase family enzyme